MLLAIGHCQIEGFPLLWSVSDIISCSVLMTGTEAVLIEVEVGLLGVDWHGECVCVCVCVCGQSTSQVSIQSIHAITHSNL